MAVALFQLVSTRALAHAVSAGTPPGERREFFEAALANMEQSLFQMRDNLNNHADEVAVVVHSSESGRQSGSDESVLDDATTDSDDDAMSPRGIYMKRCAYESPLQCMYGVHKQCLQHAQLWYCSDNAGLHLPVYMLHYWSLTPLDP